MKNNVEWWQLIVSVLAIMLSTFGIISMYANRIEERSEKTATITESHEQRIKQLELQRIELKQSYEQVSDKIDKMTDQNTQILILLQNKQDRKK